jgi:hypothetical protein
MSIEKFKLSSKEIYAVLQEKKVKFLYHANTVGTSMTFIENRALLSRSYVENNDLYQTEQNSDKEDKTYDVWNHIFLDGADLHKKYSRANHYGPVLFRLKLELLISPNIQNIYVTKSNPWYWTSTSNLEDKFYSNVEDIKNDYLTGEKLDSQIMLTFRKLDKEIKLNKYLHSIGLDKPKLLVNLTSGNQKNVGQYAEDILKKSLHDNGLGHIPILMRHKKGISWCRCQFDYNYLHTSNKKEFKKRFNRKSSTINTLQN